MIIEIAYLKSYVQMGQAAVRCISGCTCNDTVMEGHHDEKTSQLYLHEFSATQHDACVISLTVLASTQSHRHKVKVSGIMISEEGGGQGIKNDRAVDIVHRAVTRSGAGTFEISNLPH